ncbi:calcium-binding protein [Dyella sp. ASV21]|uniref:beta strand repeat-containing protein n=1 Tax=Dyella sp. ASV21 TaxID=2795114 RepID=UPI0018EB0771|nr:calcium-binding protein [Dyella sp. ASV21]
MANDLTPLVPQTGISNDQAFTDNVGSLLEALEGVKKLPYLDDKGIPTVGIGINLHSFATPYFLELPNLTAEAQRAVSSVLSGTYTKTNGYDSDGKPIIGPDLETFNTKLASAMAPYGGVSKLVLSNNEIEDLYQRIVAGVNGKDPSGNPSLLAQFKTFLGQNNISSNLLTSREGLSIFSLFFNGAGKLLPFDGHIVPDLKANALGNLTNRADAWFQIRYGSNAGALTVVNPQGGQNGVAIRRDIESTIFGLYDSGDITSGGAIAPSRDEAMSIYADLSSNTNGTKGSNALTNRQFAFNYENRYKSLIGVANSELHGLLPLAPGETTAQLTALNIQTLEYTLQPAAATLIQNSITDTNLNLWVGAGFAADTIDALDVQVAAAGGGNELVASQRNGYQLNVGGYLPSLLIAQGGTDTLDGSGSGSDALIGGTGNDALYVGSGNDYIVAGTGDDLIEGNATGSAIGNGNDTIVLGASNNAIGGNDTLWAGAGSDKIYVSSGNSDHIHLNAGGTSSVVLVNSITGTQKTLAITATSLGNASIGAPLAEGSYYDSKDQLFILTHWNSDGSQTLQLYQLAPLSSGGPANGVTGSNSTEAPSGFWGNIASSILSFFIDDANASDAVSTGQAAALYNSSDVAGNGGQTGNAIGTSGVLELDNFQGNSDAGIQLSPNQDTSTGQANLSLLDTGTLADQFSIQGATLTSFSFYADDGIGGSSVLNQLYGSGNPGGDSGYLIQGDGNATYISAGSGTVFVEADTPALNGEVQSTLADQNGVTIQGGAGDQMLVGLYAGKETIIGGDDGQDTGDTTYIDGAGADALITGSTGNNVIYGGIGQDTLEAGVADAGASADATTSLLIAGLSFYDSLSGFANYNEDFSPPSGNGAYDFQWMPPTAAVAENNGSDFQIEFAALTGYDTFTDVGLLGSSLDSGVDGSTTMPGSLLVGGTGTDYLIGNGGNDTLIGGDPLTVTPGYAQEYLVGGAGDNLLYGGGGNEFIYADLNPYAAPNWADLDPHDSDTIYGGSGLDVIYGSGGNDVIYGGNGNYVIHVGNGNSYVDTGSGSSSVYGGTGNEMVVAGGSETYVETGDGNSYVDVAAGLATIFAGTGNDTFEVGSGEATYGAGDGAETFIINAAGGNQYLQSPQQASSITLDYANDVASGDIEVRADSSGDLALVNTQTGNFFSLEGYFNAAGAPNVTVTFSDGTTWGAAQLAALSITPSGGDDTLIGASGSDNITAGDDNTVIVGMSGNNTLTGGAGADTIQGGTGADTIEGGSGNTTIYGGTGVETYVFNTGDGSDTIVENSSSPGTDKLTFGAGVTESDVTFMRDGPSDLLIAVNDPNSSNIPSTIYVPGFFSASSGNAHAVTEFSFADGTTLSAQDVLNQAIYANNSSIEGAAGSNYFAFGPSSGINAITQTNDASTNTIAFVGGIDSSDVVARRINHDLELFDQGTGTSVVVFNYFNNDTGGIDANFAITFSDGITWTASQILTATMTPTPTGNDTLWGSDGNDTITAGAGNTLIIGVSGNNLLTGGAGNDTIDGGTGADTIVGGTGTTDIVGGTGADTFVFNSGGGSETIDAASSALDDVLKFGSGITASDLTFAYMGADQSGLMIIMPPTDSSGSSSGVGPFGGSATITIPDFFTTSGIAQITFANGTTLTPSQVTALINTYVGDDSYQETVDGALANALYMANDGAQVEMLGGPGNDTFYAGSGADSFYAGSGASTFYGGAGKDLMVGGAANNQFVGGAGADTMEGGSGSNVFIGGSGNDSIVAGGATNVVELGAGSATIASGGADTYEWNGEGNAFINPGVAITNSGTLIFGTGITPQDLIADVQSGATAGSANLTLGLATELGQITINGFNKADSNGDVPIGTFQFADGETLTLPQMAQVAAVEQAAQNNQWILLGSNESITVSGSNDSIDAQGSDTLNGGAGTSIIELDGDNNTVVFNRGDGMQTIEGAQWRVQSQNYPDYAAALASGNTIAFGEGVRPEDVSIIVDGGDLLVRIQDTADAIDIANWSQNTDSFSMTFTDGTHWSPDDLVAQAQYGGPQVSGVNMMSQGAGAQLYDPAGGNDTLGLNPGDAVLYGYGYGDDTVAGNFQYVQMRPGVTSSEVTVGIDSNGDLQLTLQGTGEQLTISNFLKSPFPYPTAWLPGSTSPSVSAASSMVPRLTHAAIIPMSRVGGGGGPPPTTTLSGSMDGVLFADGTVWNFETLAQHLLAGSNGFIVDDTGQNQALSARSGFDTLIGGSGQDTLAADGGNDVLMSTSGNDLVELGAGNDFVVNGSGNDTFDYSVGDGDATLVPGDLQLYRQGIGSPNDSGPGSELLELGQGIDPSDVQVRRVLASVSPGETAEGGPADLQLTIQSTGKTITIPDYFSHVEYGGQYPVIQFADGTQWTPGDILPMTLTDSIGGTALYAWSGSESLTASAGHDTIYTDTNDAGSYTIDGGVGGDVINAGTSADGTTIQTTLLFGNGSGHDTFNSSGSYSYQNGSLSYIQDNFIEFAAGVSPSDVSVTSDAQSGGLTLSLNGGADAIDIPVDAQNVQFQFADGTVWSYQDAINIAEQQAQAAGGAGSTGSSGSSSSPPPTGDGDWTLMSAPQLFDEIASLTGTSAVSEVSGNGYELISDNQYAGSGHNQLEVIGQNGSSTVTGQGEPVVLYDASALDYDALTNADPTAGGTSNSTTPVTFTYEAGSGSCTIVNYDPSDFALNFSSGITAQEVRVAGSPNSDSDLQLAITDASGQAVGTITLKNYFSGSPAAGEALNPFAIQFADGTTWNSATIYQMYLQSAGDHYLTSGSGDTVFAEGGYTTEDENNANNLIYLGNQGDQNFVLNNQLLEGVNTIIGGLGADTFAFSADSGTGLGLLHAQSSVIEQFNSSDVVDFGPGVAPSQLQVTTDGSDLILNLPSTSQFSTRQLVIDNYFDHGNDGGGTFVFADGVSLTGADFLPVGAGTASGHIENVLLQDTLGEQVVSGAGYDGNDTLVGVAGDTLEAGPGNDQLIGKGGAVTYLIGHSTGDQTITGSFDGSGASTLQFAPDVLPSDVAVVRTDDQGTLEFILKDTGQTITLTNYFQGTSNQGVQQVVFADGTTWNDQGIRAQAQLPSSYADYLVAQAGDDSLVAGSGADTLVSDGGNDTLVGGTGENTIYGGSGSDFIEAGTGDSSILGGSGNEIFQLNSGFGQDTLIPDDSNGAANTLQFGSGLTAADVSLVEPNASDLELVVNGGGSILLPDALVWGSKPALTTIQFADGTSWSWTQLLQQVPNLVQASPGNESITAGAGDETLVADAGNDALAAGSGNDTLVAGAGQDTLVAGGGNDELIGGTGTTTYVIGLGTGIDTVLTSQAESQTSTIQIAGASVSNATFHALDPSAFAIDVTRGNTLSEVIVRNSATADQAPPSGGDIAFADGTTVSVAQLDTLLSLAKGHSIEISNDQNDIVGGSSSVANVLYAAGGGNDSLEASDEGAVTLAGGSGSDTFSVDSNDYSNNLLVTGTGPSSIDDAGHGNDAIEIGASPAQVTLGDGSDSLLGNDTISASTGGNVLNFASGISPESISLQRQGNDLLLVQSAGSTLDLAGWYAGSTPPFQQIDFADGTIWYAGSSPEANFNDSWRAASDDMSVVAGAGNDTLTGSAGPDTLTGGSGADLLVSGTGNESFQGGSGAETFEFNSGFGQDTLVANDAAVSNTIAFTGSVVASNVTYAMDGNDLLISLSGSVGADGQPSTIRLPNHFVNGTPISNDVDAVTFADGTTVTMTQINGQFASGTSTTNATVLEAPLSAERSTRTYGTAMTSHKVGGSSLNIQSKGHLTLSDAMGSSRSNPRRPLPGINGISSAPSDQGLAPPYCPGQTSQPSATATYQSTALNGFQWHEDIVLAPDTEGDTRADAVTDPVTGDLNDVNVWTPSSALATGAAVEHGVAPQSSMSYRGATSYMPPRNVRLGRTASVAADMIKALSAQGGVQALIDKTHSKNAEIQLQDGTLWSLSALDRTMAAWSMDAHPRTPASMGASSFGSADLAHAQLVEAMAIFSPQASAESGLPPTESEAYAVALAAQMH